MLKISKENLNGLYRKLSAAMPLYMPLKKAGEVNYGLWTEGAESSVETLKTVKSPKDLFFPQSETMMKFKTEGKSIEIVDVREEKKPFVLFGVRALRFQSVRRASTACFSPIPWIPIISRVGKRA